MSLNSLHKRPSVRYSRKKKILFTKKPKRRISSSRTLATLTSSDFKQKHKLPILHYHNVNTYPQWHAYIQRIYKEGVNKTAVDLNRFTWFYYNAPFETMPVYRTQNLCTPWENSGDTQNAVWLGDIELQYSNMKGSKKEQHRLKDNDAFVGVFKYVLSSALIRRVTNYGFFVRRNVFTVDCIKQTLLERKRIEILHVKEGQENTITWFWLVKGSGVFLDVSFAKTVVVLSDRSKLPLYNTVKSKAELDDVDMNQLQGYMRTKQIDILVFVKANGVPEMVVRHENVRNKHTFCLPDHLFCTGLHGTLFMHRDKKHNFPMLHLTPRDQPPVWFTETESRMYKSLLADEHKLLPYLNFFIAEYGTDTFRQLLKKWFPMWYFHPTLQRWIDFLATPLLFAYIKNDVSLVRFIENNSPIAPQLLYTHPHNPNVSVNDILFSYTSIYPQLVTIPRPVSKTVFIVVPYVSQHFWHFMMGEFLPTIAVILKTAASKVRIVKQSFFTCPFNAFYKELHIDVEIIKHLPSDVCPSDVHRPLRWNYFNQGQKQLLIRAVEYLKDWSMSDSGDTSPSSGSSSADPSIIIVQDRTTHLTLQKYFAETFATEYKKATFESIDSFVNNVENESSCTRRKSYRFNTYGTTARHVTNLKDIAKDLTTTYQNCEVQYQTDDHLTLKEQIQAYQSASTLVLGHGSGMLHILWMPPHSNVLEIIPKHRQLENNGYRDGCRRLCNLLGFRLRRIVVDDNVVAVDKRLVRQELATLL